MKSNTQRELDRFNATENPIYAWWTYRRSRENGEPIPDEVLNYFDSVAFQISVIAVEPPKKRERLFEAIAKALKLTQKKLTDYKRDLNTRKFAIALEESYFDWIAVWGTSRGWRDSNLGGLAKENGVSESTAMRILNKFLKDNRKASKAFYKKYQKDAKLGG